MDVRRAHALSCCPALQVQHNNTTPATCTPCCSSRLRLVYLQVLAAASSPAYNSFDAALDTPNRPGVDALALLGAHLHAFTAVGGLALQEQTWLLQRGGRIQRAF